jgi:SAM-dependent methyltransferase
VSQPAYDARTYWDRRLEETWSLQGVGLKGYSAGYNRWLYRVRDRVFHRALKAMDIDPRGAEVLDVGPGVGFYTQRWLRAGASVTGVDIADSAVRRLRLRLPAARFEQRDISDPDPDLPGNYDVVDAFDVLFHIVDEDRYRQAIANVHALLRDGGYFLFTDSCARRREQSMKHYVRRSWAQIEDVLLEAGFEIVFRRPAFVLMLNPFDGGPLLRRIWRRLSPYMKNETTGSLIGAVLYLPELVLTRFRRTGPTTEIVLCRKRLS